MPCHLPRPAARLIRVCVAGTEQPLLLRKHILIMTLLGTPAEPAPTLQSLRGQLSRTKLTDVYWQCVRAMRQIYWNAQLVHADLSAYNILYADGVAWIVDVSQAVLVTHPEATAFLLRDCRNVLRAFDAVSDAMTDLELFVFVTAHPGAVALTITDAHDDDDDESDDDDGSGSDDGSGQGRERRRRRPGRAEVEVDDDAGSDASADSQSMSTKTDIFTMHDLLDYGRLPEFVTQVGTSMTTYGGREPHAHVRSALHTRSRSVPTWLLRLRRTQKPTAMPRRSSATSSTHAARGCRSRGPQPQGCERISAAPWM